MNTYLNEDSHKLAFESVSILKKMFMTMFYDHHHLSVEVVFVDVFKIFLGNSLGTCSIKLDIGASNDFKTSILITN